MTTNATPRPETIKFFPVMGLTSARVNEAGGAWRLFILAKNIDNAGLGKVSRAALLSAARDLGVNARSLRRWINAARGFGLFTDVQNKAGEWQLILTSYERAAAALGCETVGTRKAEIKTELLFSAGWRAVIFAAYEQTKKGKPTTRAHQQDETNIPESTQRNYDNLTDVERKPNYIKLGIAAKFENEVKEDGKHKGIFIFWNKETRQNELMARVGDSRNTNGLTDALGRGRSRKINNAIKQLTDNTNDGLYKMQRALSYSNTAFVRLFNSTHDQLNAQEKKIQKGATAPDDLFLLSHRKGIKTYWNRTCPNAAIATRKEAQYIADYENDKK